ncbi:MAG: hypothetical protein AAGG99_09060 [Pseudomonadota bacterium]
MKLTSLFAALFILLSTLTPALACACEIDCKPGESYSDQEEMCMPDTLS